MMGWLLRLMCCYRPAVFTLKSVGMNIDMTAWSQGRRTDGGREGEIADELHTRHSRPRRSRQKDDDDDDEEAGTAAS